MYEIFNLYMKFLRYIFVWLIIFPLILGSFSRPTVVRGANLTQVKDTLQTSRMSFSGRVKSPTISGSTHVWIYTAVSGNATSVSTAGLKPGDSLVIGGTNSYTIGSIIDDDEFTTTSVLAPGDADDGDVIYFKSKPQHTISFTTDSAVASGFFRVLVAAGTGSGSGNDTIPDDDGWDFNSGVDAVASPSSGYAFSTGVATAAGTGNCAAGFHCFEFHYTGTGSVGTPIAFTLGNTDGTNSMVAPAPSTSRVASQADTYTYKIQLFPNGADPTTTTPTDIGSGKMAVIESVRVTATVDPSITFKVEGVAASTSTCGLTTDITTTATAVPFGVLALDTFKVGSQKITVSTNAVSGYAVTAIENERLSNLAGSPSYIPNTTCDTGGCTNTTSAAWATAASHAGFGYTVAILSGTPTIAPTSPLYQRFPSIAALESPFQIMSNTTSVSSQQAYVCYKIAVDSSQPAGNYENQITFTATATF